MIMRAAQREFQILEHHVDQRTRVGIAQSGAQHTAQDLVIDRREELPDVAWQHIAVTAGEAFRRGQRPVRPLTPSVRVRAGHEGPFEDRLDDIAQRVMYDAIAERRSRDAPALRLVNPEAHVAARAVRCGTKIVLEIEEVVFETMLEGGCRPATTLASRRPAERQQQVAPGTDRVEHRADREQP